MEITKLFKINNQQIILSPTQQKIFNTIFRRENPRVIAILPTQYGKSLTVALAVLLRAVSMNEKWVICAPSEKKAKIIMGYVIDRLFDNEIFYSQLEVGDSLERVKRERSKNRLTFKRGGEIMILTLDSRNGKKSMEAAMGFGCFEYNQKVLTENGYIKIGELYRSKPNIKIACFDEQNKNILWHNPKNYQKNKKGVRRMVKVIIDDKEIICTENHKIFVKNKGWIEAIELKKGDIVFSVK